MCSFRFHIEEVMVLFLFEFRGRAIESFRPPYAAHSGEQNLQTLGHGDGEKCLLRLSSLETRTWETLSGKRLKAVQEIYKYTF